MNSFASTQPPALACRFNLRALACIGAFLLCVLVACAVLFPAQAHATFKDIADAYPAAQELGSYGKVINGSDLPDGAYKVGARTTSRMCIMYTNPANAEARDSKEQAIVSVSGGKLTAVFYISKAYNYLYFGTAEQAAAATNKKGTKASAYIAGDPEEGYVPHLFSISIPALNKPITMATFSGGDKGIEGGMWYTREVVFTMTDAELKQIKADAKAAEEEAQRAQEAEEEAQRQAAAEEEAARKAAEEEAARKAEEAAQAEQTKNSSTNQAGTGGNSGGGANGNGQAVLNEGNVGPSESQDPARDEPEAEQSQQASETPANNVMRAPMRGVRMNIVNPEIVIEPGAAEAEEVEEAETPLLTEEQIIVLLVLAALVVGVLIRYAMYRRAFDVSERN